VNDEWWSRKLFWSTFSQTVSVLVVNSAPPFPGEIVADLFAWRLACPDWITRMAQLAIHISRCAVLQLHVPNDEIKPASV
jgi:hypothetical protein